MTHGIRCAIHSKVRTELRGASVAGWALSSMPESMAGGLCGRYTSADMRSWAVYRKAADSETYLGMLGAEDEAAALRKARLLVPEAKPGKLTVRPWAGEAT